MSFSKLLYFFIVAWVVACAYYSWKIIVITRQAGKSRSATAMRKGSSSRMVIRHLYRQILLATTIFVAVLILAYFILLYS